jgi:hypothetical protein
VRRAPDQRPEFRRIIDDEAYGSRLDAAIAGLGNWTAWKTSHQPAIGQEVVGVIPDTPAARNRLKVGDVVTRRNAKQLWGDGLPRGEDSSNIEYYSQSDDRLRTLRLGNEPFGVKLRRYWRPEFLYVRGKRTSARWDRHLLAAIATRGSDPDFAETALQHAVAAGYTPDALSDQLGAELALYQNRYDAAAEFAWFAEQAWQGGADDVSPLLLLRVALANGHLDVAHDIAKAGAEQLVNLHPMAVPYLLANFASQSDDDRLRPAPSLLAVGMYRDDLRKRLRGSTHSGISELMPKIHTGEPVTLLASTARFSTFNFELPGLVPNFDFSTRISGRPTDQALDYSPKAMYVGVVRVDPGDTIPFHRRQFLLRVDVNEHGDVQLVFGPGGQVSFPDLTVGCRNDGHQEVRIVRVGGTAEVFLNGHRVFYGPVDDAAPMVQFSISVVGMTSTVHSVEVNELIERAPSE